MSQIANVVFAYSPRNDDELELTVGDRIEVIGYEEEGWLKGKLKGRTGVFPSNFVQIIDQSPSQNSNRLNSLFGSLVNTKNSLSSHSLNTTSTAATSSNNNNSRISDSNNKENGASMSNSNPTMNNTPQHEIGSSNDSHNQVSTENAAPCSGTHPNQSALGERRPKPMWEIGYGDIFAAGAKAPSNTLSKPPAMASERLSAASAASTLTKPIPKKPPPPAPSEVGATNGLASDQAPALPPKPSCQFRPFAQQQQQQRPLPQIGAQQQPRPVVERVVVIYAYKPSNSDELELEVGDVIDVLDKNIEDAGWWRGELRGKVGVFPDNFVQPHAAPQPETGPTGGWRAARSNSSLVSSQSGEGLAAEAPGAGGRVKSVFAGTPRGFSKELESNLERHSNPGAFLSLKRGETQHRQSGGAGQPGATSESSPPRQNGFSSSSPSSANSTSPGKLNHITAGRAKGPARRPPKNTLNRRSQLNDSASSNEYSREAPKQGELEDSGPVACEVTATQTVLKATAPTSIIHKDKSPQAPAIAESQSQQAQTQQGLPPQVRNKLSPQTALGPASSAPNSTQPSWMVELRKTNAEKKREPPLTSTATNGSVTNGAGDESISISSVPTTPVATLAAPSPAADSLSTTRSTPVTPAVLPSSTSRVIPTPVAQLVLAADSAHEVSDNDSDTTPGAVDMATDNSGALKQISSNLAKELGDLRLEVRKLQQDFQCVDELKRTMETMKAELRACQSATESQRKYIKDLVTNLADERKKIAAMQVELDRNLK